MKRLLPILLCFLAFAVPRLYGQKTYPVTFSAEPSEGGTITATIDYPYKAIDSGQELAPGVTLNFFAVPEDGYQIDYWEINGDRSDVTDRTLKTGTIEGPLNVVAHFKIAPAEGYPLHFSIVGDGKIEAYTGTSWDPKTINDGDNVPAGADVNLKVTPNEGKVVGDWTINGKKNNKYYGKKEITYSVIAESTISVEVGDQVYNQLTFEATAGAQVKASVDWVPVTSGSKLKRGSMLSLAAQFDPDYKFDHWEINGTSYTKSSIDYQVMEDTHVKLFARLKDQFPVNFSAEANGEVAGFKKVEQGYNFSYAEIASGDKISEETSVALLAKPSEGYHFVCWTLAGDTLSKSNAVTYKVTDKEVSIIAHFAEGAEEGFFPIHFSSNEGGKLTGRVYSYASYAYVPVKDGYPIKKGSSVDFKTVPDSLYMVKSWIVNGKVDESSDGKSDYYHTFDAEDTVRVEFVKYTPFYVTFDVSPKEGGSIEVKDRNYDPLQSGDPVPEGTKIQVYAYTEEGYEFDYWEINGERSSKTDKKIYDYVVTENVSFKAYFRKLAKLPVTFSANGGGAIEGKIGYYGDKINSGDSILEGSKLTFTATAEAETKLRDWTVNGVDTLAGKTRISYEVQANKANTIVANFVSTAAPKAVVTFTYDGEGGLACTDKLDDSPVASGESIPVGKVLKFVATPATGYTVSGWTINGEELFPNQATIEYTVIEGTNDIKAHFKEGTATEGHMVTFFATPTEGGTLTAVRFGNDFVRRPFQSGERVNDIYATFTAKANQGYVLEKWIVDGEEVPVDEWTPNEYTHFNIKADLTVEAVFKQNAPAPSKVKVTYSVATEGGKLSVLAYPSTGDPYPVESGDEVDYATNLFFQAEANAGYTVEKWTVNGKEDTFAGNDNMLSMPIQENTDVKVYFKKEGSTDDGYSVTFAADPFEAGKVTATYAEGFSSRDIVSGDKVPAGKYVTFVAEAYAGYEFEKFTVNGLDAPVDYTNPEQYATELSGNLNVVAHFKSTAPAEEYTVSFAADPKEGGTVTATYYDNVNEKDVPFETGAKFSGDENYLTFTAKANDGYQIVSWSANGKDVTPSDPKKIDKLEYQAKEALDLKVVFKKVYPLTLTATKGGSLVAKVGDKVVKSGDKVTEGTKVTIEATPKEGYELTALTAGTEDILAAKFFVMKGATEVKATFTKLQKNYVVTLKSNDHGTITIKEKVDLKAVPEGTKLTVVAKGANDKCELTKLTANGVDILKDKTFTVTKDTEVVAVFVDHTGIDAVAADAFVIYPNPASESATVTGLAPEAAVALYTLDGQLITRLAADRSGRLQIDLTALSEGTYLVVTEGATQRLVVKH